MENNSLLSKLNDLEARFQEVSTLITDPAVVADMKRYVRLNKEYRELEMMLDARRRYVQLLTSLGEAKDILARCQTLQDLGSHNQADQLVIGASTVPGQCLLPEIMAAAIALLIANLIVLIMIVSCLFGFRKEIDITA